MGNIKVEDANVATDTLMNAFIEGFDLGRQAAKQIYK